jgi:PAS domain S-box-containing protein
MAPTILLHTFPHDDVAFRLRVEAAQSRIGKWAREPLQAEVRLEYPSAVVHQAEPIAESQPGVVTWYAYRDGRVATAPTPEWWREPDLPRTVVSEDRHYIDANDGAADLFGVTREQIIGAPAGSFTRHQNYVEVSRRVFAVLQEVGVLHSTAIVVRPDGEEFPIEYHTTRASVPGAFVTVMRRLPKEPEQPPQFWAGTWPPG